MLPSHDSRSAISRRSFVQASVALGAGALPMIALAQEVQPLVQPKPPLNIEADAQTDEMIRKTRERKGATLDSRAAEYFVVYAHGNIEKVRDMLAQQPRLVNSTMDWGNGDWETALGGASHMGRRDIALLLLEHGARPDIFTAAMLGWLDAVKAMLAANPALLKTPGPHGIPLLVHAQHGGKEAETVVAYLESLK